MPGPQTFIEMPSIWRGKRTDPHRGRRILPSTQGYFVHVTSRAVHQRFLFKEKEKKAFSERLEIWSDFSGISVLTHCLMDNHFHLLLWIPPVQQVDCDELVRRIRRVWPEEKVAKWVKHYRISTGKEKIDMKKALEARMHSLPAFMRILKQSFSVWFNHQHDVCGTLWEGRYRSMIVKDSPAALTSVAKYIDLNPVRANICRIADEYPWSGFGKAMKGDILCRRGLTAIIKHVGFSAPMHSAPQPPSKRKATDIPWDVCAGLYQQWLGAKTGADQSHSPARNC
jgi:REP element-mobilizing transposase RayT